MAKGFVDVMANLERAGRDVVGAARLALHDETTRILKEANKVVPVRTGFLKNSGYVTDVKDGSRISYYARYAMFVHERKSTSRRRWRRGKNGKAKKVGNKQAKRLGISARTGGRVTTSRQWLRNTVLGAQSVILPNVKEGIARRVFK